MRAGLRVGSLVETVNCNEFCDGTIGMILKSERFSHYIEYTTLICEAKWVLSNTELQAFNGK